MKKPPSRLRRLLREVQLVSSAAAAVAILYALVTSPLLLAIADVLTAPHNAAAALLLRVLLSHGTLLAIVPAVCFALRWVVDAQPARLGFGSALLTEGFLVALRFNAGGFEEQLPLTDLGAELALSLLAGWLGTLAARTAARKVAARIAAEAAAAPPPVNDLAEALRAAQQAPPGPPQPSKPDSS